MASKMTPRFLTAHCGSLVAVADTKTSSSSSSQRLSVPLYSIDSSLLQSTLTCSVKDYDDDLFFVKLLLPTPSYCCALLSNRTAVVWSIARGVVVHTLTNADGDDIWDMASIGSPSSSAGTPLLHVLIKSSSKDKLYVHEYDLDTCKCVRKIKCGSVHHDDETAQLAVSSQHIVLRYDHAIKILSLLDGSRLGKKIRLGKASGTFDDSLVSRITACSTEGTWLATTSVSQQGVIVYHVGSQRHVATIPLPTILSDVAQLSVWPAGSRNRAVVMVRSNVIEASLYEISMNQEEAAREPTVVSAPACRIAIGRNTDNMSSKLVSVMIRSSNNEELVTIRRNSSVEGGTLVIECASYKKSDLSWHEAVVLDDEDQQTQEDTMTSNNKRSITTMLGPGQAGGEALRVQDLVVASSKRQKIAASGRKEQEEEGQPTEKELSIAERLQQMRQAMEREQEEDDDEEDEAEQQVSSPSFTPKSATTESLSHLLGQALQSGDDTLLELALGVRDERVLSSSFRDLESSHVERLLQLLTTRLASKPNRASDFCIWIKCILMSGKLQHGRNTSILLRPLCNLLQERIESFPHLLRLEGRLSMMGGGM